MMNLLSELGWSVRHDARSRKTTALGFGSMVICLQSTILIERERDGEREPVLQYSSPTPLVTFGFHHQINSLLSPTLDSFHFFVF